MITVFPNVTLLHMSMPESATLFFVCLDLRDKPRSPRNLLWSSPLAMTWLLIYIFRSDASLLRKLSLNDAYGDGVAVLGALRPRPDEDTTYAQIIYALWFWTNFYRIDSDRRLAEHQNFLKW